MNIGELKRLIENIPDDFNFRIDVSKRISDEKLSTMSYPYPFESELCDVGNGSYDICWSEKNMKLDIEIKEL